MKSDLISRSELKRDLQRQFKLIFQEAGQKVNPEDYYIQRNAVYQADLVGAELEAFYAYLDTRPAVDAVEVVRCKDCWHHNNCGIEQAALAPIGFFCALGERKDDAK